jgi:hypothetical protein
MRLGLAAIVALAALGIGATGARAEWVEPFDRTLPRHQLWVATGEAMLRDKTADPAMVEVLRNMGDVDKDLMFDKAVVFCKAPFTTLAELKLALDRGQISTQNSATHRAIYTGALASLCPQS